MKACFFKALTFSAIFFILNESAALTQPVERLQSIASGRLEKWENPLVSWQHIAVPELDSLKIIGEEKKVLLFFNSGLSYYPFREESCDIFRQSLKKSLGRKFRNYNIGIFTNNYELDQLVPNLYRKSTPFDRSRLPLSGSRDDRRILLRNADRIYPARGLYGNSIALWHSHGYYYEMDLDRWEFQRAKLFGTVEDIAVMAYVVPYLARMLENAGATVFLPRERDIQINEVIVDNDRSDGKSELVLLPDTDIEKVNTGFLLTDTLFAGFNPFRHGSSLRIKKDSAVYIPDIPEYGSYAVYVSYPLMKDNCKSVLYTVNHTGGSTRFIVDQTMGGGTWIYLGTFVFDMGKDVRGGSVSVKSAGNDGGPVALDAVKFGGGMGNVARKPSAPDDSRFEWKTSGKPRFLEGARYYLQYAGMPDTLVYSPNAYRNDYNDDYQSRSLWVNYLMAEPFPEDGSTQEKGLGIPLDLSLAFHTDAGVTPGDSVIGTLAIYSTASDNGVFPDGTSRLASRDLSDIIQSQIVDDIRRIYNPEWTRRGLWDRLYYEARKPDVPAMLLELLSHQNLADLKYGLDPEFRFDVSRAVYKGILKYLAYTEGRDYVVQPLPVTDFAIMPLSGKTIRLSWKPASDESEPGSQPDRYVVYMRTGENGFDNGTLTEKTFYEFEIDSLNTVYGFKVTAVNDGGESFDSEILSVGINGKSTSTVLIVNGFDRVSGPAWFDNGSQAGIAWWKDRGVAYHHDFITIGDQHDFNRKNPWLDDDSPGWGASYSDIAGTVSAGNTFDYPYIHGKAVMEAGYSFCSVSGAYFCSPDRSFSDFKIVDLIFGEQKSISFFGDTSRMRFSIYTPEFMNRIREITASGTSLFMSGSYVGSDLLTYNDSTAIRFAGEYLHFMPRTGHAARTGDSYATDYAKPYFSGSFRFNTDLSPGIYQVEAPDAIEPHGKGSVCAFRYGETNSSAGVIYEGEYNTVVLGFPFETIISREERASLMKQILKFLEK